jgi:hypothetical protein
MKKQGGRQAFTTTIAGQPFTLRVTSTGLHGMWGEGVGARNAAWLVEPHRQMIEDIVAEKSAARAFTSGNITSSDVDLDM